jgi:hypothetical protein
MKIKYIYPIILALLVVFSSCDKNFEEINTNPIAATSLDPAYLFANAQRNSAVSTYHYQGEIVQQIVTPYGGVLEGGNRNTVNDGNSASIYNTMFTDVNQLLVDVTEKLKDNPDKSNLYNMARIWKAYCFQVLVDTYGDVPYTEAGKGYLNSLYLPKYDDQETIYADILKEYEEATDALDASKATFTSDLFYRGDIAKWKKLGNSLLLRAGMRYTKYNANTAKAAVQKAIDPARGGVMASNADNAFIQFNATFTYGTGSMLNGGEKHNYYVGAPFVAYLKLTNDPRMLYMMGKYDNPVNPVATAGNFNTNPADQLGMPYGYDENSVQYAPNFPGKVGAAFKYTQYNRLTVGKIDGRENFVTYALTQLLLAEATFRGYISTGTTAQTYYETGIKAHMTQTDNLYGANYNISVAQQNAFLAGPDVAYTDARALELINTQYWVASSFNWAECWANFRRSGFPVLSPIHYQGEDPSVETAAAGGFIHRLPYPLREKSVNPANWEEASTRIGGDNLGTRTFWDVQ